MAILKVNGNGIKDPQTLTWGISDLDSEDGSGRNQRGVMFRDRVAVKRKLTCTWGPLTKTEAAALLSAVEDAFFTLTYPDALTGADRQMTAYVGDRSLPMYRYRNGDYIWEGLSMNFVEK